jgi:antitoxin component of MazEF toxin-antitoxin module
MPRNEIVKEPEETITEAATAKPVSVRTTLSGPTFRLGPGVPSCSLKIPSEILEASGLKGNDQIELSTAGNGMIIITKVGEPLPGLPNHSSRNIILDNLMALTHDYEKRQQKARNGLIMADVGETEPEVEPLLTDGDDLSE